MRLTSPRSDVTRYVDAHTPGACERDYDVHLVCGYCDGDDVSSYWVTSLPYDTRVYERVSTMGLVLVRPLAPPAGSSVVPLDFPDGTIAQISVDARTRGQVLVLKKSQ
ncbi:hypothetical protein [Bifidobacterium apri]|uniref:hypothetical protein n=1 Tax=Bifidobacterium apri TaxID=1769423 RepID=UPI0039932208